MATSREHYALAWIKSELLETLDAARKGLEAFAEAWENGGADSASANVDAQQAGLRRCIDALHQVHGSMVMLELQGLRQLTDHLERVASALQQQTTADVPGASQSLMQGILELPGHLDLLQSGAGDSAATVFALVNELRQHLGEAPLEDGSLAGRLRNTASQTAIARFEGIDGSDKTRRIRAVYQQVLLALLKGGDLASAAGNLRKIAEGMRRVCGGTALELQWQAFGEFVESLTLDSERDYGPIDGAAVKLLRRVDAEIREVALTGTAALERPVSMNLMRQLIDGAVGRGRTSPLLAELAAAVAACEQMDGLSMPGRQALVSAAAALREELSSVKDRLDLFVRAERGEVRLLGDLLAPLKQVASTLSLLGFESSKSIVHDQVDVLSTLIEADHADGAVILSVAAALVQVDDNLASLTHGGRGELERITDDAQRAVAEQARAGLDRVKQGVVDYVSSQWDVRHLEQIPAELAGVIGALSMIPLALASLLLQRCRDYVGQELMAGHVPSWQELDQLADAISGIDYYLERLASDKPGGAEEVLDLVQRSLDELGAEPAPSSLEPEAFVAGPRAELRQAPHPAEAGSTTDVEPVLLTAVAPQEGSEDSATAIPPMTDANASAAAEALA
ncbi:MAG: hypothetical protein ACNA7W_02845, partial [Pseudomonadales bacterium]